MCNKQYIFNFMSPTRPVKTRKEHENTFVSIALDSQKCSALFEGFWSSPPFASDKTV
jgi:hypothetical protein